MEGGIDIDFLVVSTLPFGNNWHRLKNLSTILDHRGPANSKVSQVCLVVDVPDGHVVLCNLCEDVEAGVVGHDAAVDVGAVRPKVGGGRAGSASGLPN